MLNFEHHKQRTRHKRQNMSWRSGNVPKLEVQTCGSIFGKALDWSPMALLDSEEAPVSPLCTKTDTRPPSPMELEPLEPLAVKRHLESAIETWRHSPAEWQDMAFCYFELERGAHIVSSDLSGVRLNKRPVAVRMSKADSLTWAPVVTNEGITAHSFALSFDDVPVATFVVIADDLHQPQTVRFTHAHWSPLKTAAGMCDQSANLVFDVANHTAQLVQLINDVEQDDEQCYLPTTELLIGKQVSGLQLTFGAPSSEMAADAEKVWGATLSFFEDMKPHVRRGVNRQNAYEMRRCQALEFDRPWIHE